MLLAMPFIFVAVKLHDRHLEKHLDDMEGRFDAYCIKNDLLDMMIRQNHRGHSMILDDLCDRDRSDWDYACAVLDDYRALHPRH